MHAITPKAAVLIKVWFTDNWESPKHFREVCSCKIIFIIILKILFFFFNSIDMHTNDAKVTVSKTGSSKTVSGKGTLSRAQMGLLSNTHK